MVIDFDARDEYLIVEDDCEYWEMIIALEKATIVFKHSLCPTQTLEGSAIMTSPQFASLIHDYQQSVASLSVSKSATVITIRLAVIRMCHFGKLLSLSQSQDSPLQCIQLNALESSRLWK
jgi:hypothetical protein